MRPTLNFYSSNEVPTSQVHCGYKNSFSRHSAATRGGGWSTLPLTPVGELPTDGGWFLRDPACTRDSERAIDCEMRITNARYVIIGGGTNDFGFGHPLDETKDRFSALIKAVRDANAIPVLQTIPAMNVSPGDYERKVSLMNQYILELGEEKGVPVINFWRALKDLPNRGLKADGLHLNHPEGKTVETSVDFSAAGLKYGANTRNLVLLRALYFLDSSLGVSPYPKDVKAPKTTITSAPPAAKTNKNQFSFTFASTERGTFECRIWNSYSVTDFERCSSGVTYKNITASGVWTFQVRAKDLAGNIDRATAIQRWSIDNTAPKVKIISGPANGTITNKNSVVFVSSSNEPTVYGGVVYSLTRNGVKYKQNFTGSVTELKNLPDGKYEILINWQDQAGNVDLNPPTRKWEIDTKPPNVTIIGGPKAGSTVRNRNPVLKSASTEPTVIGGIYYTLKRNGKIYKKGFSSANVSFSKLPRGKYQFTINWQDRAGNLDPTPPVRKWTISF